MLAACGEEKPWALLLCRDEQEIKHIIIDKPNYIEDDLTDCHDSCHFHPFVNVSWVLQKCVSEKMSKSGCSDVLAVMS